MVPEMNDTSGGSAESGQDFCTLCQKALSADAADRAITGGLCEECFRHLEARMGTPLMDYLDGLDVPVLATDDDVVLLRIDRIGPEQAEPEQTDVH